MLMQTINALLRHCFWPFFLVYFEKRKKKEKSYKDNSLSHMLLVLWFHQCNECLIYYFFITNVGKVSIVLMGKNTDIHGSNNLP